MYSQDLGQFTVKVELGAGVFPLLSAWVASKKEVGLYHTGPAIISHGQGNCSYNGRGPGTGTRTMALVHDGTPSSEPCSLGWPGILDNPPASVSASVFDFGTLPSPPGFEPGTSCMVALRST